MSGFRALCDSYVTALSETVSTVEEVGKLLASGEGDDSQKKTCLDVAFRRALLNKVLTPCPLVSSFPNSVDQLTGASWPMG